MLTGLGGGVERAAHVECFVRPDHGVGEAAVVVDRDVDVLQPAALGPSTGDTCLGAVAADAVADTADAANLFTSTWTRSLPCAFVADGLLEHDSAQSP